jgi:hypothetical protein
MFTSAGFTGTIGSVAKPGRIGPAGTIGAALTAWDLWRRIPPKQRKILLAQARIYGPRLVKMAYTAGRRTPRL